MKSKTTNFIIIDDSELDCFIAEKLIKHSGINSEVKSFLQAREALDYIKNAASSSEKQQTIILLDLLMPVMNGIQFVTEFENLPAEVQEKYFIVAFTSSMNKKDMGTMKSFKSVKFLFDKPLSPEMISSLLDHCNLTS